MEEAVLSKIIETLKKHNFKGEFVFSGYCEPLLDIRLTEFVRQIKRNLPKASVRIMTNGDFLTVDKYADLKDAGCTLFVLSQHSPQLPETLRKQLECIQARFPDDHAVINFDIYHLKEKMNRGGLLGSAGRHDLKSSWPGSGCEWPRLLTIDYAGNVILCCNDYFSSVVFGNVTQDDLCSIWHDADFVKARRDISIGNFAYDICRKCGQL